MKRNVWFHLDLKKGLEYVYSESIFERGESSGITERSEKPFGTLFIEYLDVDFNRAEQCMDYQKFLPLTLLGSGMSEEQFGQSGKIQSEYLELFNSGLIEEVSSFENNKDCHRIMWVKDRLGEKKTRRLISGELRMEYMQHRERYLPFILIDSEFTSIMIAYFFEFLNGNAIIKKCEHCGKYFIAAASSNSIYCMRYCDDRGHTCRQAGPMVKRNQKIKDDPIKDAYRKAFNRKNMARARGTMSQKEFDDWKILAKYLLESVRDDRLPVDEFLSFMCS